MPALTAPARDRIPPPGPAAVLPAHPQPCPPPSLPPSPCDPSAPSGTRTSPAPPSAARSSTECRAACGTTFPPVSSAPLRPYSLAASGLPAPADVRPLPGTASDVMTPPCSPPPSGGVPCACASPPRRVPGLPCCWAHPAPGSAGLAGISRWKGIFPSAAGIEALVFARLSSPDRSLEEGLRSLAAEGSWRRFPSENVSSRQWAPRAAPSHRSSITLHFLSDVAFRTLPVC